MGCISLIKFILYDDSNKAAVMKGEILEDAKVKPPIFEDPASLGFI